MKEVSAVLFPPFGGGNPLCSLGIKGISSGGFSFGLAPSGQNRTRLAEVSGGSFGSCQSRGLSLPPPLAQPVVLSSIDVGSNSSVMIICFTYIDIILNNIMAVQANLLPSHSVKTLDAMKAKRIVKRITFNPTEANPGTTLYVSVPKLNKHEVIVPGSLALLFNIDLLGGHVNNYLVQNVSRALAGRFLVNFAGTILQDTNGFDIYKIFEDLFLSADEREEKILGGIQSVDLCKFRSGAGDKKTSGVDAETKLETVYKNKYRIMFDHQVLTDHGVFYPQSLYNNLKLRVNPRSCISSCKGF